MKFVLIALLFSCAAPVFSQAAAEKRFAGLEKRVAKVEKRVTKLEKGGSSSASAPAGAKQKQPAKPIAVYLIKKKQIVTEEKIGLNLYLEFKNISNLRYYAFNGILVFKNEAGEVVWSKAYGNSEPLGPGEKTKATLGVSSEQAKTYLKLVKAREIKVYLEKQEVYGMQ